MSTGHPFLHPSSVASREWPCRLAERISPIEPFKYLISQFSTRVTYMRVWLLCTFLLHWRIQPKIESALPRKFHFTRSKFNFAFFLWVELLAPSTSSGWNILHCWWLVPCWVNFSLCQLPAVRSEIKHRNKFKAPTNCHANKNYCWWWQRQTQRIIIHH